MEAKLEAARKKKGDRDDRQDQKARDRDGKKGQKGDGRGQDKAQDQKAAAWSLGKSAFAIEKVKGKKVVVLPWRELQSAVEPYDMEALEARSQGLRGRVLLDGGLKLMDGEKLVTIERRQSSLAFRRLTKRILTGSSTST